MPPSSVPTQEPLRPSPSAETSRVKVIDEALSILDGETNFVKTSVPPEISSSRAGPGTLATTSHAHPNIAAQSSMSSAGDLLRSSEISQDFDGPSGLGSSDVSTWLYNQMDGQACSAASESFNHIQVMSANFMSAASAIAESVPALVQPSAEQIQPYDANLSTDDPVLSDLQNDFYSQPISDLSLTNAFSPMAGPFGTSMFIENADNANLFDFNVGGGASSEEAGLSFQLSFGDPALEDAWRSIMEDSQFAPADSNPTLSFTS